MSGVLVHLLQSFRQESKDFTIENGILQGAEVPYLTGHSSYGELILDRLRATPNFVGQACPIFLKPLVAVLVDKGFWIHQNRKIVSLSNV